MDIKLNKKEYKAVVKSLYFASAMLKSYRPELGEKDLPQETLLKQLLERAPEIGLEHWVKKNDNGETIFVEEKEFDIYEKVQEYEQLVFWHELPYRLAERDLEETLSDEELLALSIGDELDKEMDIQEKYEQEFLENGLQNLRLVKSSDN